MTDIPAGSVVEFIGDLVPAGWALVEAQLENGVVVRIKCRKVS